MKDVDSKGKHSPASGRYTVVNEVSVRASISFPQTEGRGSGAGREVKTRLKASQKIPKGKVTVSANSCHQEPFIRKTLQGDWGEGNINRICCYIPPHNIAETAAKSTLRRGSSVQGGLGSLL